MRKFYTATEAATDKFLFVSYSHDDKEIVKDWIDFLIDQGVRVWWDKAFMGGDDWETIAQNLLLHDNCSGILFFCSKSAIESPNIAKEWRTAAKAKEKCSDGAFYPQIIMIGDDPSFDYHYLTSFVKKTEELFSDDDYDDFRDLFGKKDHLYYSASNKINKQDLLDTIKERVPKTVDEHEIARDKLADLSNLDKEVVVKLGTYENKSIYWHKIFDEKNESVLLCCDVLAEGLGGQELNKWLNTFVKQSFSTNEQIELEDKIRLLTLTEAEKLHQDELERNTTWWLSNTNGNLQTVVREDGTIYKNGYNGKLYKKGIRPVITMDSVALLLILNKQ